MKPNILVIDSATAEPTPAVVELATRLARHSYVYLICPGCGFREDTAEGVRFLSHDPAAPPDFGQLDGVVTFDNQAPVAMLRHRYPAVPVFREPQGSQVTTILQAAAAYRARSSETWQARQQPDPARGKPTHPRIDRDSIVAASLHSHAA
jgi:hypothetical protein